MAGCKVVLVVVHRVAAGVDNQPLAIPVDAHLAHVVVAMHCVGGARFAENNTGRGHRIPVGPVAEAHIVHLERVAVGQAALGTHGLEGLIIPHKFHDNVAPAPTFFRGKQVIQIEPLEHAVSRRGSHSRHVRQADAPSGPAVTVAEVGVSAVRETHVHLPSTEPRQGMRTDNVLAGVAFMHSRPVAQARKESHGIDSGKGISHRFVPFPFRSPHAQVRHVATFGEIQDGRRIGVIVAQGHGRNTRTANDDRHEIIEHKYLPVALFDGAQERFESLSMQALDNALTLLR